MRRLASAMALTLLLIGLLACYIQSTGAAPTTIVVPDDYPTIQQAINAANDGDTIFVKNGTYHESILVNKTISLIGESKDDTTVDASGFRDGILITADNVTVRGFTVQDAEWWGIRIKSSTCYVVGNNLINSDHEGIFLDGRESGATVKGNAITDNHILGSYDCGILVWASFGNDIAYNRVENGAYVGIYLHMNASHNAIRNNEVVYNYDAGIVIACGCSYNTLSNNNISYNGFQPIAWKSGVVLSVQCDGNKIVSNSICNNERGIYQAFSCYDNRIYHNNIINNAEQAYSREDYPCLNIWDNGYPSGGNFWSDYSGLDLYSGLGQNVTGSDGIGDDPYVIDESNADRYPLMKPFAIRLGDLNEDAKVDMLDIGIASQAFGSHPEHPRWNPIADINEDEKVDLRDIARVARNFGKTHLD